MPLFTFGGRCSRTTSIVAETIKSNDLRRDINLFHTPLPHSHLVRGRLPLLLPLRDLPDRRSLRWAAWNSGYCCSAVAADSPCHTESGCRERLSRAEAGCYGPAPFDQSEAPDKDGPERLRGKHANSATGLFSDCHCNSLVFVFD